MDRRQLLKSLFLLPLMEFKPQPGESEKVFCLVKTNTIDKNNNIYLSHHWDWKDKKFQKHVQNINISAKLTRIPVYELGRLPK